MIVLPCPSILLLLSLLSKMNPWPHCLLTVAPKRGPSSSIVHEHCPCPFLFLFVTLAVGILSAVPKGSREEAGEHERGDIPSVTRVIFPVCSYSEVQTFPFSNPPTAQSPFFPCWQSTRCSPQMIAMWVIFWRAWIGDCLSHVLQADAGLQTRSSLFRAAGVSPLQQAVMPQPPVCLSSCECS